MLCADQTNIPAKLGAIRQHIDDKHGSTHQLDREVWDSYATENQECLDDWFHGRSVPHEHSQQQRLMNEQAPHVATAGNSKRSRNEVVLAGTCKLTHQRILICIIACYHFLTLQSLTYLVSHLTIMLTFAQTTMRETTILPLTISLCLNQGCHDQEAM